MRPPARTWPGHQTTLSQCVLCSVMRMDSHSLRLTSWRSPVSLRAIFRVESASGFVFMWPVCVCFVAEFHAICRIVPIMGQNTERFYGWSTTFNVIYIFSFAGRSGGERVEKQSSSVFAIYSISLPLLLLKRPVAILSLLWITQLSSYLQLWLCRIRSKVSLCKII